MMAVPRHLPRSGRRLWLRGRCACQRVTSAPGGREEAGALAGREKRGQCNCTASLARSDRCIRNKRRDVAGYFKQLTTLLPRTGLAHSHAPCSFCSTQFVASMSGNSPGRPSSRQTGHAGSCEASNALAPLALEVLFGAVGGSTHLRRKASRGSEEDGRSSLSTEGKATRTGPQSHPKHLA
jgi:hypothetical protein